MVPAASGRFRVGSAFYIHPTFSVATSIISMHFFLLINSTYNAL